MTDQELCRAVLEVFGWKDLYLRAPNDTLVGIPPDETEKCYSRRLPDLLTPDGFFYLAAEMEQRDEKIEIRTCKAGWIVDFHNVGPKIEIGILRVGVNQVVETTSEIPSAALRAAAKALGVEEPKS